MSGGNPGSSKRATLADLLAIAEEVRHHELLGGELFEKEAASARHGQAQVSLGHVLFPYRRQGGPPGGPGGWLLASEVEVLFNAENAPRPDLCGWRRERMAALPDEVPIRVVPDWICEILSTNRRNDLIKKKRLYHRHQVAHYWIIDPVDETLTVDRWAPDGYLQVMVAERGERVRAEPFEGVEFALGVLFGDDE